MSDNKLITFDVESAELMEEDPTSRFAWAKIQAFSSGENRHELICDEETLKRTAPTIYNTPVMYDDISYRQDFGTHTKAGQSRIAGFVVPNSAEFTILPDGRNSLNVLARIWKIYAPKVMEYFQRDNERKVSVEMELVDSEEMPNGITKMKDFIYTGIQLLGKGVVEASPGASMTFLSFAEEKKEYEEAVLQEFSQYDHIDFSIAESIKKNASKALDYHKEFGGINSVSLATARYLKKNSIATPDKVRNVHKYLDSHKDKTMNRKSPDNVYMNYMCYGGDEGYAWSKSLIEKLDESDNKKRAYFSDMIGFPYDNIKDANPSLRGIDPPITVGQANEIARQADAIGADKGGWGIAISSFKKHHKVKDGKWIKMSDDKEDNMEEPEKEEMSVNEKEDVKMDAEEMSAEVMSDETMAKETPADEKKEDPAEEKSETPEEEKKENMSLDSNLDVKAVLAILADETEEYKTLVAECGDGPIELQYAMKLCNAMYTKCAKMSEDFKAYAAEKDVYMSENMALKAFKKDVEDRQFQFEVEATMAEVSETMPKEKMAEAREDASNFSFATIDAWKNKTKALAFSFVKEKKTKTTGFQLPFAGEQKKDSKTLWG